MALWLGGLLLFTSLYLDKGVPGTHPLVAAGIMIFFWIGGIAGGKFFFAMPCVRAEVRNGALFVSEWTLRTMLSPRVYRFDLFADPPGIQFTHGTDSDGDPYFKLAIELPDGRELVVSEGHHREDVEAAQAKLNGVWQAAQA